MSGPATPAPVDPSGVERRALALITPDAATLSKVRRVRTELVDRVTGAAQTRHSPLVRALVAGSAARETFVKDRLDIDLFLLFPPDLPRARLEEEGLALGAAVLTDTQTRYAEHPYLRGRFEGFAVDAVPGYAVRDPSNPLSAVDRTPFHHAYLTERQTPELVAQVRLIKQFLRALGVYGSEARTGGFSGYLVELLALRFGSLDALLTVARSWRIPIRMLSSPHVAPRAPEDVGLLLDDPVDPHRNVASALSRRNLGLFILAAGAYLDYPTDGWFETKSPTLPTLAGSKRLIAERGTHVAVVILPRPDSVDDILYPQLRKSERSVAVEAERLGFQVVGTSSAAGPTELLVLIEVAHPVLPSVRTQGGPPPGIDRVGEFLAKWSPPGAPVLQGPFVGNDGDLVVEARREERALEPLLRGAVPRLAWGRDLKPAPGTGLRVDPLDALPESDELRTALGELLDKRLPWLSPLQRR